MIHCPKCAIPIAELDPSGVTTATCSRCRFSYRHVHGKLTTRGSRQITHRRQTTRQTGSYSREYELRIALPSGQLEQFSFTVGGREDQLPVRRGDVVGFFFSMRGTDVEEFLRVYNLTTGDTFRIREPGSRAQVKAGWLAVIAAGIVFWIGISIFPTVSNDNVAIISFLAAVVVGFVVFLKLGSALAPTRQLGADAESLTLQQTLLRDKQVLEQARDTIRIDYDTHRRVRERLWSLKQKMLTVGREMYETRLATIDRAVALLDSKLDVDRELMARYDSTITMVEIELESRTLTADVPADVAEMLESRKAELRLLSERSDDYKLQLSANEEVERELRG